MNCGLRIADCGLETPGRLRASVFCLLSSVFLLVAASVGCVERQIVVKSEPSDALVTVDGREIGRTPATTTFTFYGARRIVLQRDGCETMSAVEPVRPPWYDVFPLDFVSEVLWPGKVVDRHVYTYALHPVPPTDPKALVERAEDLRSQVKQP